MIEVVINFDQEKKMYKVYEPTSDTLIVTSNLSESLIKLSEFLVNSGMTSTDILASEDITYHLDSATMRAMVTSNVALLKRLAKADSGFANSAQKFGGSVGKKEEKRGFTGRNNSFFSGSSSFKNSLKKFGNS